VRDDARALAAAAGVAAAPAALDPLASLAPNCYFLVESATLAGACARSSEERASAFYAGNQIYRILPEPTQHAKMQQVLAKSREPFFSFLFALFSHFGGICHDFYYDSTTVKRSVLRGTPAFRLMPRL
jgi:hypothetical protein